MGTVPVGRKKRSEATDGPQVFRSPTAIIVWWVWVLFAVANLIDLAVQGRDRLSLVAAAILVLLTGIAYVTAQRPRVIADSAGITIVNPLRDYRIGWAGVTRVDLADLLRMGRLAEAWIAPPEIRELREITRYRGKLVHIRTSCKDQVHGVLAKLGVEVTCSDIFGAWGTQWLDELPLPQPYSWKVASLRQLIGWLTSEITVLEQVTADLLAGHDGYRAVQELPGIGPVLGAVIVAEIGDITRFRHPARLSSWAGLTPRHYESDTKVIRGRITKQGSRVLRWAVIEAVQRTPAGTPIRELKDAIIARRGIQARNIAKVAAARKLLTCVFYAMHDGHVRSLTTRTAQQEAG